MRTGPAHGHRGVLGRPSALERVVLDGGDVVEIPLKERHVGRGRHQSVVILAVSHRQGHLFRTETNVLVRLSLLLLSSCRFLSVLSLLKRRHKAPGWGYPATVVVAVGRQTDGLLPRNTSTFLWQIRTIFCAGRVDRQLIRVDKTTKRNVSHAWIPNPQRDLSGGLGRWTRNVHDACRANSTRATSNNAEQNRFSALAFRNIYWVALHFASRTALCLSCATLAQEWEL